MNPIWNAVEFSGTDHRGPNGAAAAERIARSPLLWLVMVALSSTTSGAADSSQETRTAGIVGLGAATCRQFNSDVAANPPIRRDYLAWAQGFMSGIILSRPPGIDQGLDLDPPTFGLIAQLRFLEDHCARNQTVDFSAAVEALYKRLRIEGKT